MRLAQECALAGIGKAVLEERSQRVSSPSPSLLVYPETVSLARVLTRASFLNLACDPAAPGTTRRALVEREAHRILPDLPGAEAWRAVARVWAMVTDLSDLIRDSALVGVPPDDARFNVLRYSRWVVEQAGPTVDRTTVARDH